jgi:hypothetical protein
MQDIIEKYIELRDKKSELSAAYKKKVAGLDAALDQLEAILLEKLNEIGMDSAKGSTGTVYKSRRTSATVADWDYVLDHIQKNELWNMLEKRVSKQAVEQYVEEHGNLPPGINWREELVVNIRRS